MRLYSEIKQAVALIKERCSLVPETAIILGTGLGGAIIVQDRIITGAHQAAGEIGHMVVDDEGPLCTCGNYGCVEAFVGRWAIDRDIRAALRQGQQSILSEKIPIDRNILVESSSIREALEKGDALARAIIGGVACKLALVCISLRHLLDPELIVFGGGLIGVCGQYIMPLVKEAVAHDPYHNSLPVCRVVVGELGADAVILGAAVSAARALGREILTSRPCPE